MLYLAVVSHQTALWQTYPDVHVITLNQVPLRVSTPHWELIEPWRCGALETWGWPMLVIDAERR